MKNNLKLDNDNFEYELKKKELPNLEEVFGIDLPKWPQCIIYGEQVSEKTALEVIRRTDGFFSLGYDGNDRDFIKKAQEAVKMPVDEIYVDFQEEDQAKINAGLNKYFGALEDWREKWGCVKLEYLHNAWISTAWVGGPNGWMRPDGRIAYANNIGKWPEVKEVWGELKKIAEAFPELRLFCTLCNVEEDQEDEAGAKSLVSFKVWDGTLSSIEPIPMEVALERAHACGGKTCGERLGDIGPVVFLPGGENHFKIEQLQKWAEQVYGEADEADADKDEAGGSNSKQKKKIRSWKIPVTWEMYGTVSVEAESAEEALKIFREIEDGSDDGGFALPEGYYVDGSFDVDMSAGKEQLLATIEIINK